MRKDKYLINIKKNETEQMRHGTFPFLITKNGKYDHDRSLFDVYELYVNMLYEK